MKSTSHPQNQRNKHCEKRRSSIWRLELAIMVFSMVLPGLVAVCAPKRLSAAPPTNKAVFLTREERLWLGAHNGVIYRKELTEN